jgi:primary-amine oxidase
VLIRTGSNDNALVLLEVLQPNKTDVLRYLNGTAGPPPRWARVLIVQGATDEAFAVDYMVGPLPPGPATAIVPLDFCYNSGRNYVRSYLPNFVDLVFWGGSIGEGVADITQALLDGEVNLLDPDSLEIIPRASHRQNARTVYWMQFYRQARQSDGPTLLPQGLYFKVEAPPTRDFQDWKVVQWYYNGVCYDTASDLRAAIKSPSFQKSPPNRDGDWTDVEDFEEGPPGREKPPPMTVQPQGGRYSIDKDQKFVSWMGFAFYITTSPVTGVTLYDITFGGERIIYELGLQEAMVHYAGDDPQQGGLEFLDTFFGMGRSMFELVPSYDCPAYATYLSTSYNDGDVSLTNHNSICVFEYTADHALQRHTAGKRVSISRNTYLVVRSVSTMGNYDYTIEYVFYLDGTIEVKVRASGYIFAAFWTPNSTQNEDEYGYRVHDAAATSIHDHVLNFKADIDVAGTANTLVRIGIEPVSKEYAWDDEYSTPRNTMHLVEHVVEEETGLNWPSNSRDMFVVQNGEITNAWGEKRGYRITPGTGMGTPAHLTILNSTTLGKSAEWAYQDLWAVRQKDAEPKSANPLNWLDPLDPIIDFSKFVDGERIVQEDLSVADCPLYSLAPPYSVTRGLYPSPIAYRLRLVRREPAAHTSLTSPQI